MENNKTDSHENKCCSRFKQTTAYDHQKLRNEGENKTISRTTGAVNYEEMGIETRMRSRYLGSEAEQESGGEGDGDRYRKSFRSPKHLRGDWMEER